MYHDYGLRFMSPTINLSFSASDFVKFCENIEGYLAEELRFVCVGGDMVYPIAMLNDIRIDFVHYDTPQEAKKEWEVRKKRINWENVYFIMCERDECTYDLLKKFDSLPYRNKVAFVHTDYPDLKCAYKIGGFEQQSELGNIIDFKKYGFKRYYDDFDFNTWFKR